MFGRRRRSGRGCSSLVFADAAAQRVDLAVEARLVGPSIARRAVRRLHEEVAGARPGRQRRLGACRSSRRSAASASRLALRRRSKSTICCCSVKPSPSRSTRCSRSIVSGGGAGAARRPSTRRATSPLSPSPSKPGRRRLASSSSLSGSSSSESAMPSPRGSPPGRGGRRATREGERPRRAHVATRSRAVHTAISQRGNSCAAPRRHRAASWRCHAAHRLPPPPPSSRPAPRPQRSPRTKFAALRARVADKQRRTAWRPRRFDAAAADGPSADHRHHGLHFGLGQALAREFAALGHTVVGCGRREDRRRRCAPLSRRTPFTRAT